MDIYVHFGALLGIQMNNICDDDEKTRSLLVGQQNLFWLAND